jgi:predicted dehydrogenase
MWRHHPRATRTQELLRAGAIGSLRLVNVSFSFQLKPDDWRMRPERGGGAMWDIGCYGVDAARFFTAAEPADVYARARFAPTGVDLTMQLALRFPGDVLANIDCSFEAPWRCRLELIGDAGRIEWPMAFQHTLPVIHLWRTTQREAEPETIACEEINQFACQTTAFCRSIAAGQVVAPAEDGLANMRVLQHALDLARAARR